MTYDNRATWRKCGLVEVSGGSPEWWASHAALPVVVANGSQPSLYLSVRDAQGRSRIAQGPMTLGAVTSAVLDPTPALDLGELGAFDDSGVTTSCAIQHDGRTWLFYTGWCRGVTVPFYLAAGLAVSADGRTFTRVSKAPLLERNSVDPFLTASPWVLIDEGIWRMWYVSATGWTTLPSGPRHHYHIRYAESADGVAWQRSGRVCVDFASSDEYAFGRPCVLRDPDGIYRMWYSVRGDAYRIGYAESRDGIEWDRLDAAAGIERSSDGWDSEMVEYPVVFDHGGNRYMLYNGNGYGRTGVGVARRG